MARKVRGPRVKVAENIFDDACGRVGFASAAGHRQKEKRFPKDTPVKTVQAWIDTTRVSMRKIAKSAKALRGTLAGDILIRLTQIPEGSQRDNARWELMAWVPRFGSMRRPEITKELLRVQWAEWIAEGVPASTLNHRRRQLAQLWEAFDGEDAANPVRGVKRAKEVLGDPIAYPMDDLDAIIAGMTIGRGRAVRGGTSFGLTNKSRARLRFLLWTGMPPGSMGELSAHRVARELERGQLYYPAREKGAGAPAVLLPLFPRGVLAVKEWLRARAWGRCSEGSLRHALHRAALAYARAEAAAGRLSPIPTSTRTTKKGRTVTEPELTPYHLRHSFLTWLYETTGDPYLVQLYGQHLDLTTTKRYTRKGIPLRAREAVAQVAAGQLRVAIAEAPAVLTETAYGNGRAR